nr:replication associated protein [Banfec virus 6]
MRNVCFTLNNYSEDEATEIQGYSCKYLVVGRENQGTPHLQGYFEFKNPKRLETLKKFNPRIHWENRKGSAEQASNYCKKGDQSHEEWKSLGTKGPNFGLNADFYEDGEISQQGKRNDLVEIAELIINDKAEMMDIAIEYPSQFIRYHKGIEKLKNLTLKDRSDPSIITWLWGKSGVGKTRFAVEKHSSHYIKDGTQWWDGYNQEEAIIIDDFDGRWPFRDLLRLLDRYKYQGQTKGAYIKINSPFMYITCEFPPEEIWADNELTQILRRVTHVTEVGGNTRTPTFNEKTKMIENYPILDKYINHVDL